MHFLTFFFVLKPKKQFITTYWPKPHLKIMYRTYSKQLIDFDTLFWKIELNPKNDQKRTYFWIGFFALKRYKLAPTNIFWN